ncbi:MAG: alpha/beta fold hydrolase [Pseudomonadota bacterium]
MGERGLPAICLTPDEPVPSGLGILYCHAHGNRPEIGKTEVTLGRPALCDPPLGLALAEAGATVLCVDMPGFGARQGEGREEALAKAALWQGQTLLGEMLTDLDLARRALTSRPGVDPGQIAVLGISMGGTLAYVHAALSPEIAACAQLCVMADIGALIATGAHDLHGPYMTIPGLLPDHDMGDIAGLIAPRPLLIATGARDPLTPDDAYRSASDRVRRAYAEMPERLSLLRVPHSGHAETPDMRQALFAFLGLPFPGR